MLSTKIKKKQTQTLKTVLFFSTSNAKKDGPTGGQEPSPEPETEDSEGEDDPSYPE